MSEFQRGDRVVHLKEENNPLSGQRGTVTHLHEDPGYSAGRSGHREVWVQFDTGGSHWVPVAMITKI